MRDYDIVVVGELNVDLILRGDVAPAFGQVEKLIDDATLTIGSSSAIFACGAAMTRTVDGCAAAVELNASIPPATRPETRNHITPP